MLGSNPNIPGGKVVKLIRNEAGGFDTSRISTMSVNSTNTVRKVQKPVPVTQNKSVKRSAVILNKENSLSNTQRQIHTVQKEPPKLKLAQSQNKRQKTNVQDLNPAFSESLMTEGAVPQHGQHTVRNATMQYGDSFNMVSMDSIDMQLAKAKMEDQDELNFSFVDENQS